MLKATTAVVVMIVGAFTGFAASTLLYWVVVGLSSLMSSGAEAATSGALWQRAAGFGATFGLVTVGTFYGATTFYSPAQVGGSTRLVRWKLRTNSLTIGYQANSAKQNSAAHRKP